MRALLILGPTASGKSALALELAKTLDGEIVNADSMQVYADLRVLTARPSVAEEAQAQHHLYGHAEAGERYSVGRWVEDAAAVIAGIAVRGRMPILVGGTGLYFKALTEGLAAAPATDEDTRARLNQRLAAEGAPALHKELEQRDPEGAALLEPMDGVRIIRALAVLEETGQPLRAFQAQATPMLDDWVGVCLTPDRERLYAGIDARFGAMLREGALDEVRRLAARGLDPSLPAMKAHGVPALAAHLRGEMSLEAAAEIGQRDTRRYAKRQFTWIAHQTPDWPRIEAEGLADRAKLAAALLKAGR